MRDFLRVGGGVTKTNQCSPIYPLFRNNFIDAIQNLWLYFYLHNEYTRERSEQQNTHNF